MRLSRKAQEEVSRLTAEISLQIRKDAACRAHNEEREFADVSDVHWAANRVLDTFLKKCQGCGGTGIWEREGMSCPLCQDYTKL